MGIFCDSLPLLLALPIYYVYVKTVANTFNGYFQARLLTTNYDNIEFEDGGKKKVALAPTSPIQKVCV